MASYKTWKKIRCKISVEVEIVCTNLCSVIVFKVKDFG